MTANRNSQWRNMMQTENFLARVHEGMKVLDRQQHEIGKVDRVKMSDDNPATPEVEAAEPARYERRESSLIDSIAEVFAPDELPEDVRDRLLQKGFLRLDTKGLFAADRYILPEQIMSVSRDAVTLNVSKDELVKKP
jgi:hypothetical protein